MHTPRFGETLPSHRLSAWLVFLCSAANYLQTEYRLTRTVREEDVYKQMADLMSGLKRGGPHVPPLPVANEDISAEQIFVGLDRYARAIGWTISPRTHPSRLLHHSLSHSLDQTKHAGDTGAALIRALLGVAQLIEGQAPALSTREQGSRLTSERVKHRLRLLFWEGMVYPFVPRIKQAQRRLAEANKIRPIMEAMIAIVKQKAHVGKIHPNSLH